MSAERDDETKPERSKREGDDLFSALPRKRPGSRSELRDRARKNGSGRRASARTADVDAPVVAEADAANAKPPEPSAEATSPPPPAPAAPAPDSRSSVEGLAWAGVTAAAEVATLGVKLATRAMGAVRGAVERR